MERKWDLESEQMRRQLESMRLLRSMRGIWIVRMAPSRWCCHLQEFDAMGVEGKEGPNKITRISFDLCYLIPIYDMSLDQELLKQHPTWETKTT